MKRIVTIISSIILSLYFLISAAELDSVRMASRKVLPLWQAFSLSEVKLTDSYFLQAMERHKEYVLSLEVDRLIPHVRRTVGLEGKGENYGGWEKNGGCTYGHYMSSCAMFYVSTGDERFLQRLNYILSELKLCQENTEDGWFVSGKHAREGYADLLAGKLVLNQPDETKQPWNFNKNGNSWYCIHKVLAGLRDAYVYASCDMAKEIMLPLADYIANIALTANHDLFQGMLAVEAGGMNEVFTDIYAITGEEKYLETARRFNHITVIYPIANGEDVLFGRHANDQIPKFVGVVKEYEYTGEELYKKAGENFWKIVTENHTLAIGGNSCYERFGLPGDEVKRLDYSSAETCNTYNMLKLSRQMFMLTGDLKYLNYYEHALYNHILASQDPDLPGCVTYYTSLLPGSFKQYSTPYESFWCCVGTGMENHAKYAESVYFLSEDNLLVNLFIPSELDAEKIGVRLMLDTKFPDSDSIRISLKEWNCFNGALSFRIPQWLQTVPQLYVNGFRQTIQIQDGYLQLKKGLLKEGDVVLLVLPRSLHIRYAKGEPHYGTLMHGPLVLAAGFGNEGMPADRVSDNRQCKDAIPYSDIPMLVGNLDDLKSWIVKKKDAPNTFMVKNTGGQQNVCLVPYFKMHHQYHTVYWKIYSEGVFESRMRAFTDEIKIGDERNERKHNLSGQNDSICWHDYFWAKNTRYRVAEEGGWFAYDLRIDKDENNPYYLICRFWGDESDEHEFDVLVNDSLLTTVNLNRRLYLTYVDDIYKIPQKWTEGKDKVCVKFQAKKGKTAGGLYGLKITSDIDLR